jgi:hypothetical protein
MRTLASLPLLAGALLLATPAARGSDATPSRQALTAQMQGMMTQMQGMMARIQGMMGGQQVTGGQGMMGGQHMMGGTQGQAGMMGTTGAPGTMMPRASQLQSLRGMAEGMQGMVQQMQALASDSRVIHDGAARASLDRMRSQMAVMMQSMNALLDHVGQAPAPTRSASQK